VVILPSGQVATYSYDPFGRRIKKQLGNDATWYVYADEGLVGEYSDSGSMQKIYGWMPDGLWGTDPLYMLDGSGTYFYHNDHLGTPRRLTDATTGAVVWSAGYAAFGAATIDPLSTVENNLRFPGQYFDAETSLHYNWNRTYDPGTGRYTQVDPIGFAGGDLNVYRYVENGPLSFIDPLGLEGEGSGGFRPDLIYKEKPTRVEALRATLKKLFVKGVKLLGEKRSSGGASDISDTAFKGAKRGYEGIHHIARRDYMNYMQSGIHLHNFNVEWEKYGDTFEEAFRNYWDETMSGEKYKTDESSFNMFPGKQCSK
jgi:RHS repeat-associated protein